MAIPHYQFAVRNVHQSFRGLAASAELYSKDRSKLQDTGGHFLGKGKDSWRIFLQRIWYTIEGLFLGTPQITVCKGLTGGVIFDQIHQGCGNLGTHDITGGVRRNRSNKPCEAYMRTHMSQRETHWVASPLYHGFILCRNRVYEISWSLPAGDFLTLLLSVDVYFRPWDQFRYLFRRVLLDLRVGTLANPIFDNSSNDSLLGHQTQTDGRLDCIWKGAPSVLVCAQGLIVHTVEIARLVAQNSLVRSVGAVYKAGITTHSSFVNTVVLRGFHTLTLCLGVQLQSSELHYSNLTLSDPSACMPFASSKFSGHAKSLTSSAYEVGDHCSFLITNNGHRSAEITHPMREKDTQVLFLVLRGHVLRKGPPSCLIDPYDIDALPQGEEIRLQSFVEESRKTSAA